jgi:alkylation response protein AidB-like acyl-CoA dehydrogenase
MLAGTLASPRWDSGEQRLPPGSTIRRERANMTTPSFDVYRLPEEHEAVREAVREVCAAGVAPHAAEADETGEFPKASYDALRAADFHAPHIPEEYGGAGGDGLAMVIVIEEVARVCASSSLVPAVNKVGHPAAAAGRLRRPQEPVPAAGRPGRRDVLVLPVGAGGGQRTRRR